MYSGVCSLKYINRTSCGDKMMATQNSFFSSIFIQNTRSNIASASVTEWWVYKFNNHPKYLK